MVSGEAVACGCGHDHAHDHESTFAGGWTAAAILLIPVVVAVWKTPDEFSARAIQNKMALTLSASGKAPGGVAVLGGGRDSEAGPSSAAGAGGSGGEYGAFTLEDLDRMVKKSEDGNYLISVVELFYTAGDEEIQRVLAGLPVETTGQVLPDRTAGPTGERLRVFRLYIECCAADARPLSVPVEFADGVPGFKEMGWYRIVGTMRYRKEKGVTVPVLEATVLEETEEPRERMTF